MPDPSRPAHTCLVGPCFVHNSELTAMLASDFLVTLASNVAQLVTSPMLANVDILLLDCAPAPAATLAFVPELRRRHAGLDIVLVDGGVTQNQLASAFAAGARDYFPADTEPRLLAGRVRGLAHLRQSARTVPPTEPFAPGVDETTPP